MSRCFPFPPPGYEKKTKTDDVDLLKKDRHKEKKHKKEKKDKEKRESKEKREKDRSDGKHREKKDKKEKHRDKKEKKDRDKDKDRNNNLDDKRIPGQPEIQRGGKPLDEKKSLGKFEGQTVEKFIQKEKEKDTDRSSLSGEKKSTGKISGYNGERLGQTNHLVEESQNLRFLPELGRRVRDDDKRTGNQLVENFTITSQRLRDDAIVNLVAKSTATSMGGKEKIKDKTGDDRKLDGQGIRDEARFSANTISQNLAGTGQSRVGVARKPEKDVERVVEGNERTKEKEGDVKHGDKRKDKDNKEKKGHGKDRGKKKEEKAKEKGEEKNKDKLKGKDDLVGSHNIKALHLSGEGNKSAVTDVNVRKRKVIETNGFLHANDMKPNKLPRPPPSHPFMENGRTLELGQASFPSTSDRLGTANNPKADNKERKVNGTVETQPFSVSAKPSASAQAGQNTEVSMKPPHPDSKYLSEVLSVPKMEELCEFDDEGWLFHNSGSQSEKPKLGHSEVHQTPLVWAEALRIESADIFALPYVIPY